MKNLLWVSLFFLALAAPRAMYGVVDPCTTAKSSTPFSINTGGGQQVIAGVSAKQIYVCNIVFSGSAAQGFNITFAGNSASCSSGFTSLFGSFYANNNAVVSTGGGGSTQFTVPFSDNFCIELGGTSPLQSSGWIVYVQR
jgi:hypothetical protein